MSLSLLTFVKNLLRLFPHYTTTDDDDDEKDIVDIPSSSKQGRVDGSGGDDGDDGDGGGRLFYPTKDLSENDYTIIDMLNSHNARSNNQSSAQQQQQQQVAFCICDPSLPDVPIIFASDEFCNLTGYTYNEIEGKNCRFLQGVDTKVEDVNKIRYAIKNQLSTCVNLLNYRKDGSEFVNEFFIAPLKNKKNKKDDDDDGGDGEEEVAYFIGVQCMVDHLGPGQMPSNPGWVYSIGSHV